MSLFADKRCQQVENLRVGWAWSIGRDEFSVRTYDDKPWYAVDVEGF